MRFVLPLPPSTNNLYVNTGSGRAKSAGYKKWLEEALPEIMRQRVKQRLPNPPYSIVVWCYFKEPILPVQEKYKRRDASNYHKAVEDAIVKVIHIDDEWMVDTCQHKRYDKENPRCVVYLGHAEEEGEG